LILNLALFGSVVRRISTRTALEWAGCVTEPALDCCETGLASDDVQGTSTNRNGKFSTGLYTKLKFYRKRCNDRGHDLYSHFGRLPEWSTIDVMYDYCCKWVSLL